ncbi:hypothetical protein SGFS_096200 [Streptomyces graminofaciens]|uniref:Mycothiol-dependent maleylpyruvate isomerase metal-binding domain-containing protein n=1 Tax=Streptomyces graminofaciens TaxID=68212 RepID=A0ABM7FKA4_9ACTN|nr:hypothetical protein SGFS_096200 [Streptomyces graminofaciens]
MRVLEWVGDGQARLQEAVDALPPHAVAEPSALPGWTRGHLLTHLARNADALVNLLTWARTGVRTPMYTTPDQRASDWMTPRIDAGAGAELVAVGHGTVVLGTPSPSGAQVSGPPYALAVWLTGRGGTEELRGELPKLPRWI